MSRGKVPGGKGKYGYYKRISKSGKILHDNGRCFLNPGNFKEAHKNFVEKMEEYEKKENLTEEEAQYNIEMAVEALKKYRAEQ